LHCLRQRRPVCAGPGTGCKYVAGDNNSVNDALLNITDLHSLAENNKTSYPVNYSGNIFDAIPPSGGGASQPGERSLELAKPVFVPLRPALGKAISVSPICPIPRWLSPNKLTG